MIVYLFLFDLLNAFNENLTAVHYSIVTPGIDQEVKPGKIIFQTSVETYRYILFKLNLNMSTYLSN